MSYWQTWGDMPESTGVGLDMTQHTLGPWWAVNGVVLCGDKNDPEIVCAPSQDIMAVQTEDDEGNARLIAAAPEMLAFMREHFESWYSKASNIRKVEPAWVPTARALLAKIEGKE